MSSTVDIANFPAYAAVVGAAGTIALPLLAQVLKKFPRLNISAAIHTMVVLLAAAMALAQYVVQLHGTPSLFVPGISFTTIYGLSQLVYKYGKYAQPLLDKAGAFLVKPLPVPTVDATVPAMDVPADVVADAAPAAPDNSGFNY